MTLPVAHPRDFLHGITLEMIVVQLVQRHGWRELARRVPVRCFQFNPSVKSSLTFLRQTPWARRKIEDWFIAELLKKSASPGLPSPQVPGPAVEPRVQMVELKAPDPE